MPKEVVMKVLVADDSLVTRKIIENALRPIGFEVIHATNGQEALKILDMRANEIELVLLDWNMPVQNGFETVKRIRGNDLYGHICIIMVSTESEDDKIGQALAAGASGYVTKPFSPEELTAKIQSIMKAFKSK
jgi:two-component system chemotaxis response regulator CheY